MTWKRRKTREAKVRPAIATKSEPYTADTPLPDYVPDKWAMPTTQDWEAMSVEEAHQLIQKYLACYQEGARIVNQKNYDRTRNQSYVCIACGQKKSMTTPNGQPNYVWRDDRKDPQTGLYVSRFICTQMCWMRGQSEGKLTSKALAFRQEDSPKPPSAVEEAPKRAKVQ